MSMAKKDDGIIIVILGTAQDAGVPQLGCQCSNCAKALADNKFKLTVASLGIINLSSGNTYLIDSTVDISEQVAILNQCGSKYVSAEQKASASKTLLNFKLNLNGILLTHAHMGHYMGLAQLGKESASVTEFPVYSTLSMMQFLSSNEPFKSLIENRNVVANELIPGKSSVIDQNLNIIPISVQHRHEYSDTVGYLIKGMKKQLLYVPDIDVLSSELVQLISNSDIAIIDGTFYDKSELPPHRKFSEVQHPVISESAQVLERYIKDTEIYFTHFNHTNPIIDLESDAAKKLKSLGFGMACQGQTFEL
jgi:pyrroloquinoline quinone biosynthesis protein B